MAPICEKSVPWHLLVPNKVPPESVFKKFRYHEILGAIAPIGAKLGAT